LRRRRLGVDENRRQSEKIKKQLKFSKFLFLNIEENMRQPDSFKQDKEVPGNSKRHSKQAPISIKDTPN